jgi:hypothetical protein
MLSNAKVLLNLAFPFLLKLVVERLFRLLAPIHTLIPYQKADNKPRSSNSSSNIPNGSQRVCIYGLVHCHNLLRESSDNLISTSCLGSGPIYSPILELTNETIN